MPVTCAGLQEKRYVVVFDLKCETGSTEEGTDKGDGGYELPTIPP